MTINQNGLFFEIFFIFLYCKIVISFLELFSATYFLFILQIQLTRRNTSIPKKHRHMTFMMTSLNDNKSDICHFFIKTYFILQIQYMHKIFWDTACFFTAGLPAPTKVWLTRGIRFSRGPRKINTTQYSLFNLFLCNVFFSLLYFWNVETILYTR